MKVKELIELLKKQDQEKTVLIQQGEEADYMKAYSVKEKNLVSLYEDDDEEKPFVVIEFN